MMLSKPSFVLILIALALSLNSVSFAQNPNGSQNPTLSRGKLEDGKRHQPIEKQQPSEPDQRGTDNSPIVVKIAPNPNAQAEAVEVKREKELKAAAQYRTEITTWIVAIATAIQAVALFFTIQVTRRTAQRQLRAYIAITGDNPFVIEGENGIRVVLRIKNVGKTPAFKLDHWMGTDLLETPLKVALPMGSFTSRNIYLPPGESLQLICHWDTQAYRRNNLMNLDNLNQGALRFYIWGEIKHKDAFHRNRYMRFRFTHRAGTESGLDYCEEGNEAD